MRSTFKVLLYVKKGSERPNGNLPLMCRLTVDGEIKQFSCKMDIPLRLWDVKNNRASGKSVEAQRINRAVDKIRVEVNRRYQELMQTLMDAPMKNTYHELVRDLFIFSVFTGLAYSDVKNLTTDNLQTFFDGNLWIITRRKKTNTESNIRLLDVPQKIIEKYKGMTRDGHVFPMPSNTTCNKILKEIGRQCGFKTRLSTHVARHTNATTVLLSNGVPIETVSRLLGHTNIKTTQLYAKITAQKISQDMEILSHKLTDMEKNICSNI
ncbi:site-specific integrase [uncultured Muribaculum sp.]|uniref:site-specific integrase n=1 Tax=uncultured Muribaculum sp. TaxID=1918613 RepID=UPI0025B78DF0|nr:site-specific integrase [uncultured Muribaculum sp.]